jgi:serine/threonine-protein kinase
MLATEGPLDPALAAELVAQAGSALDAAHARGLVHRDVKPGNLLVSGLAEARPHVYLTDFGLARRDGSSTALTTTGQWMGTPDYAAPEQIDGDDVGPRTDVYALGCVLFAALAGAPPFGDRPRMAKAGAHLHEPPPTLRSVRPDVPLAFEPVVARALAKRPGDRYASAGELGAAASAASAARGVTAGTRRLRRAAGAGTAAGKGGGGRTARLARSGPASRPIPVVALFSTAFVLALGLGIAAALGAFSSTPHKASPPRVVKPIRPPAPPAADPVAGTVRCSSTACAQNGARVEPPIEGSPCRPNGSAGTWTRIDADGQNPLFGCTPAQSPPTGVHPLTAVPDLAGARLDNAERLLDRFGVHHDTSGGGTFGIIDRGNWTVCTTTPAVGAALAPDASVKLFVERSC